jgi:hypothetical protein
MARVLELTIQAGRLRRPRRVRVDLHGISTFGPGDQHTLIRWEHVEEIVPSQRSVTIRSLQTRITVPAAVFGLEPDQLVHQLEQANSIFERGRILDELSGPAG